MTKKVLNGFQKLSELQDRVKCAKNHYNEFGNYNYRSAEDIQNAIKPICKDLGLLITIKDKVVTKGNSNYIKAIVKAVDIESGEVIEKVKAYAREDITRKKMNPEQLTGSASSYARKYALSGLLLLDDIKDADTTAIGANTIKHSSNKTTSSKDTTIISEKEKIDKLVSTNKPLKNISFDTMLQYKVWMIMSKLSNSDDNETAENLTLYSKELGFNNVTIVKDLKGKALKTVYGKLSKEHPDIKQEVKERLEAKYIVKVNLKKAS